MMTSFFWGDGFDIIFSLMFLLILSIIVVSIIRGLAEWNKNNQSPRLSVEAMVVAKRQNVTTHTHNHAADASHAGMGIHTSHSTDYYVTFQVESGDRMEMEVSGEEYGMLVEGDFGKLSFQGTRYLGFERIHLGDE